MNTGTPAPADLPGALETAVVALTGARLTSIDWTPPAAWGPTTVRLAFDTGSVIIDNDATFTSARSFQRISLHHRHAPSQLISTLENAMVTDASVEPDALTLAFEQRRLAIPAAAPSDRYCAWAIGNGGQEAPWLVCRSRVSLGWPAPAALIVHVHGEYHNLVALVDADPVPEAVVTALPGLLAEARASGLRL